MAHEGPQASRAGSITIASGAGTLTLPGEWVNARWVRVAPVAETDTFDVTIKDGDGIIMASRTGQLGTMSEKLEMSLGIMKTITIANAVQDGTYKVRLDLA